MSDGFVMVAQCVEGLPLGMFVWELLLCGFLAWFMLGSINESSPLAFSFVSEEWVSNEWSAARMSAALAFGNFCAILAGGWIADRHGRMAVVRPALLLTIACGMLLQMANTLSQALVVRFILGLCSGSLLGVMPPLIAELLPSRHRGFYLTIWCCGWPAGALFSILLSCLMPSIHWRVFNTIMLVPAVVLYICARAEMIPESPRWLYMVGRRDEGYNTLLDMYEKEDLPMPWSSECVAVSCAPPSSSSSSVADSCGGFACFPVCKGALSISSGTATTAWLAAAMFTVSAAAQSMKLWMPTMLVAQEADDVAGHHYRGGAGLLESALQRHYHYKYGFAEGPGATSLLSLAHAPHMLSEPNYDVVLVLAQAYAMQFVGVVVASYASTCVCRKSMVRWSIILAALFTVLALMAAERGMQVLIGPLMGVQLAMQATGLNFLQVFASEHVPTSRRAKTTAIVNFAAQLGNFTIPALGGLLVRHVSASGAVIFFGALYVVGFLCASRLPLPTKKEQPLHDIDEPHPQKDSEARARKREWMTYQTI
mmetsp:Transcript_73570/g.157709  ORF Transcript_73570/g.157709 Transcript_73570/m.157709 type:complete len:539 (-) Transcript_73570:184-1800(-)